MRELVFRGFDDGTFRLASFGKRWLGWFSFFSFGDSSDFGLQLGRRRLRSVAVSAGLRPVVLQKASSRSNGIHRFSHITPPIRDWRMLCWRYVCYAVHRCSQMLLYLIGRETSRCSALQLSASLQGLQGIILFGWWRGWLRRRLFPLIVTLVCGHGIGLWVRGNDRNVLHCIAGHRGV